jgi:hypothetical protein
MHHLKQLALSIHPLVIAVGIDLSDLHEIIQIVALSITSAYTIFRIRKDFFKNNNNNEKN